MQGESGGQGLGEDEDRYFPAEQPWLVAGDVVHLVAARCSCGELSFPRRYVCAACGNVDGSEDFVLNTNARVYSYTEVHVAPEGFAVPYKVGYVDFDEGLRIFGQIETETPHDHLDLGDTVRTVLGPIRTRQGETLYSYKFVRTEAA